MLCEFNQPISLSFFTRLKLVEIGATVVNMGKSSKSGGHARTGSILAEIRRKFRRI
jgi:hypothetical protein